MATEYTQASLNLSTEEKRTYGQLFQQADTDGLGVVTGDVAVKFFERTRLDPGVLAQIWQIADAENRGLLTPAGFSVALRLIGHCQAGREPARELALQVGPLPRFDAIAGITQPNAPSTQSPIAPQTSGPIRVPPLIPEKVNEFAGLFEKAGARNGYLGGDAAKSMFERARLPNETLGRIWMLADTEQRGGLNLTEFVVAMHLITSMKNGSLRALPQTLPPGLYDAANRRVPTSSATGRTMTPQLTGQGSQRPQSPMSRPTQFGSPSVSAQSTGNDWVVTPQEKTKFDELFASVDKERSGYLNGEQAVSFFSASGLSEDILAAIWDLADINSEGRLNRDEFAVAMYLIKQQRGKKEDRGELPTSLPPPLIPPSMRQKVMPPSQPTAPPFDNATHAPQQPKSAADDLFGLDALSNEATPQQGFQQSAGAPATSQGLPPAAQSQVPQASGFQGFKPFQPSSSFGRDLAQQGTESPQASQQQSRGLPQQSTNDDLLGDNDAEISSKLTSDTSDLGNMSNQLGSLRTQMSEAQTERSVAENENNTTGIQKRQLETRLASFRAQYEQEIREVKALKERLQTSRTETQKLQQEMAMIEGTHADLQAQHKQVATALEADQKENASLKDRIQRMNAEVTQLRPQLDKMRSEARQQKGMVAINKKQLATSESEKEKVNREMKDVEQASAASEQAAAASRDTSRPSSPIASPPPSVASNNNPFFRKAGTPSDDRGMSPSAFSSQGGGQSAFDSFFGPSDAASVPSQPPPATSFRSATPTSQSGDMSSVTQNSSQQETSRAFDTPGSPGSRQPSTSGTPFDVTRNESSSSFLKANETRSQSNDLSQALPTQPSTAPAEILNGYTASATPSSPPSSSIDPSTTARSERELPSEAAPSSSRPPIETVPGAFPGGSSTATTPTTETSEGDRGLPTAAAMGAQPHNEPSSAFGAFTTAKADQATSNSEFPPIKEVDQGDDSDSTASEAGFDDDFTGSQSTAPNNAANVGDMDAGSSSSAHPVGVTDTLPVPKPSVEEVASSNASQLPTPRTEQSPPSYNQAIPGPQGDEERESNQFPREYGDLLPSREITHSPPTEVPQSPPPDLAGASPTQTPTPATLPAPVPSSSLPTSAPKDDFDSAFDDLSEAKQADETDAFGSSTRSDYEFNPNFDSPAPSHNTTSMETPRHQPSSSFDSAFGSSTVAAPFSTSTTQTAQAPTTSSNHDWDDLFSGLDNSTAPVNGDKDPFELSPSTLDTTSSEVRQGPAPTYGGGTSFAPSSSVQQTPTSFSSSSQFPTTSVPPEQQQYDPPSSPPPGQKRSRPTVPARAISQGTEHDDPILKQLMGMGYPRDRSLQVLEKYDYNIDMAADHLATRS